MSNAEYRLAAALHALRPAARDPAFRLAVLERQTRRRLHLRVATLVGAGAALTCLGIAAEPFLRGLNLVDGVGVVPVAMLTGSLAVVGWCLMRMRRPI